MAPRKKASDSSTPTLGKHEGQAVSSMSIEVRGIAGGLDEGLKIAPTLLHIGDEFTLTLRCRTKGIRFDEIKDTDTLKRVVIATATEGALIDDDLVADALDDMAQRIEQARGVMRLPIQLQEAHDRGEHEEEPADGCPSCDPDGAE